jgi:glycolate oxidase
MDMSNILKKFEKIVGESNCLSTETDRACYSFDSSPETPTKPDFVVMPKKEEQVGEIIELCSQEGIPLVVRGGGTNLSGGTVPVKGGCVLVTTKLNKILEVNPQDMYAVVEAGTITASLNEHPEIKNNGLFYAPDPGSMKMSTIGGNVAENAGGLRGLKYGVTKDYVMGTNFYDASGGYIKSGGKTVKLCTGFNLPGLLTQSEGTLGVMTRFILKLIPAPSSSKSMQVLFDNILNAGDTVSEIIANRIVPATLELMDNYTIRTVEAAAGIGLPTDAGALLLIELDGHPSQVEEEFQKLEQICKSNNGSIKIANNAAEKEGLWEARRLALSSLARSKPTLILEDATVPRSKITEMMKTLDELKGKYDLTIGTFGHAGDGNLHPTILTDRRDKQEMERVEHAIDEIFAKALELGGTISGEHGIGTMKAHYLKDELNLETLDFMKKLKKGVDPENILNPHKMGL